MFNKKQNKNETVALPRSIRKKVIIYAAACCVLLLLSVFLFIGRQKLQSRVDERELLNKDYQTALANVESVQKTLEEKRTLVKKNCNSIASPILDEQTLYSYITNAANKFDLTIGFVRRDGDPSVENGVATQHYQMMFTGSDANLKLLMDSLETLPSAYTIDALSFRVKTDKDWIQRAIDENTTYGWYTTAESGATKSADSTQPITLAEMLDYEEFTLYLDIAFVSTE